MTKETLMEVEKLPPEEKLERQKEQERQQQLEKLKSPEYRGEVERIKGNLLANKNFFIEWKTMVERGKEWRTSEIIETLQQKLNQDQEDGIKNFYNELERLKKEKCEPRAGAYPDIMKKIDKEVAENENELIEFLQSNGLLPMVIDDWVRTRGMAADADIKELIKTAGMSEVEQGKFEASLEQINAFCKAYGLDYEIDLNRLPRSIYEINNEITKAYHARLFELENNIDLDKQTNEFEKLIRARRKNDKI